MSYSETASPIERGRDGDGVKLLEQDWPHSASLPFIEHRYGEYLRDPSSVPPDWREWFRRLDNGTAPEGPLMAVDIRITEQKTFLSDTGGPLPPRQLEEPVAGPGADAAVLRERLERLKEAFRAWGHLAARVDPLKQVPSATVPELDPAFYGITPDHMDRRVEDDRVGDGRQRPVAVRDVVDHLRRTYCGSMGVEFYHIPDASQRRWIQQQLENPESPTHLDIQEEKRIFRRLTEAAVFEAFLREKFVGAKSFSLEGSEALIPLLDLLIERAAGWGVEEILLGMAHRGRLNVLANIMGKPPRDIFREFDDADAEQYLGRGDVKYHLGYSSDWTTAAGGRVHLSLSFNPSHLEFVNPVVLGRLRARQDRAAPHSPRRNRLAVLIHGDAAFAGQGVVQETLNLSRLEGYTTAGALHVILNNQIGFTTPPHQARSGTYATDVAKMLGSPIFHVNGEDLEAVARAVRLAVDFRATFGVDVFIDLVAYRRLGHNEGDEPSFTQPLLYAALRGRSPLRDRYLKSLVNRGVLTLPEARAMAEDKRRYLEEELRLARSSQYRPATPSRRGPWAGYAGGPLEAAGEVDTSVEASRLSAYLQALARVPEGFHLHPKLVRFLEARREMAERRRALDWSAAEALAFASLAAEGHPVRLSGQDSQRGTFSQRHAVLHDTRDGRTYMPLQHVDPRQARVEVINSPLSEAGVLGFEYGYSLDEPRGLILWEAQFGDFANAAQVIIDQFLASAEEKWNRLSGLVLLLPHGFEGQGPEHSSARPERYLDLAAEYNIQVVYPSTPAQYFHCLRRQVLRPWRKPLVVFTPKSLLRHPEAVSTLKELASGRFETVMADPSVQPGRVRKIVLCTGKIYYELHQRRRERGRNDVALVRVEQLYPLDRDRLQAALAPYPPGLPVTWVQEEPANMGFWPYWRRLFGSQLMGRPLLSISRPESASPATGSYKAHRMEQEQLLQRVFEEGR